MKTVMLMGFVLFIFLSLPPIACSTESAIAETFLNAASKIPEHPSRVVGGFHAINGRFPFGQVALLFKPDDHQCGGTIVAPDMILTAGHCSEHFNMIKVGEYNRKDSTELIQMFRPVRKIVHPDFQLDNFRYDAMLVKLSQTVQGVRPVVLNSDPQVPALQTSLTLIGWGTLGTTDDKGNRVFPDVLQQAVVPYVPNNMCQYTEIDGSMLYEGEIFEEMLCAGSTGVDACRGDSGSPLIHESWNVYGTDLQVGIVSWGRGCGRYPGVYTRISKVFPWIRSQICWESADPPSYLNCQPNERPPTQASQPSSGAPSSSPPSTQTNPNVESKEVVGADVVTLGQSRDEDANNENQNDSEDSGHFSTDSAKNVTLPGYVFSYEDNSSTFRVLAGPSIFICLVVNVVVLSL